MDARSAQRGFARLISRISCRTSRGTLGLPGRRRDFQRQKPRNPARSIPAARLHRIKTVGASRYGPRPEEVQEDPPEQIENLEHPAFIARFRAVAVANPVCLA